MPSSINWRTTAFELPITASILACSRRSSFATKGLALIVGAAAPAHDLDRHARRDGHMRADQIGPGKIEVSDVGAPALHEPVELVGGKGDMRGIGATPTPCAWRAAATRKPQRLPSRPARPARHARSSKTSPRPSLRPQRAAGSDEVTFRPPQAEQTRSRIRSRRPELLFGGILLGYWITLNRRQTAASPV